jgi:hypothetical protein
VGGDLVESESESVVFWKLRGCTGNVGVGEAGRVGSGGGGDILSREERLLVEAEDGVRFSSGVCVCERRILTNPGATGGIWRRGGMMGIGDGGIGDSGTGDSGTGDLVIRYGKPQ